MNPDEKKKLHELIDKWTDEQKLAMFLYLSKEDERIKTIVDILCDWNNGLIEAGNSMNAIWNILNKEALTRWKERGYK